MRHSALLHELGVRHLFGDRTDGVSRGVYARGNAGLANGDDAAAVQENRRRFAARLGEPGERLCTLRQVHGRAVLMVTAAESGRREGDALVTATPGLIVAVTTADCVPVLLADPAAAVVGAVHAGWRGAVAGVIEAAVERMVEQGARRERLAAAIGPAIRQSSYEVDPPFRTAVLAAHPEATAFFRDGRRAERWQFDLPAFAAARLAAAGVKCVDDLGVDTVEESLKYFSHRRGRQRGEVGYGLQLSGIVLPK